MKVPVVEKLFFGHFLTDEKKINSEIAFYEAHCSVANLANFQTLPMTFFQNSN